MYRDTSMAARAALLALPGTAYVQVRSLDDVRRPGRDPRAALVAIAMSPYIECTSKNKNKKISWTTKMKNVINNQTHVTNCA